MFETRPFGVSRQASRMRLHERFSSSPRYLEIGDDKSENTIADLNNPTGSLSKFKSAASIGKVRYLSEDRYFHHFLTATAVPRKLLLAESALRETKR